MKETIYTKPLRMPDDFPGRATASIKVTEEDGKVTKVEKIVSGKFVDVTVPSEEQAKKVITEQGKVDLGSFTGSSLETIDFEGDYNTLNSGLVSFKLTTDTEAEEIGENAFYNCEGLTSMTLTNNILSIRSYAFANCPNLKSIIFEDGSVPVIADTAVFGDEGGPKETKVELVLKQSDIVELEGTEPLNYHNVTVIYVPDDLVDSYKEATNWDEYADIILPMSTLKIDKNILLSKELASETKLTVESYLGEVVIKSIEFSDESVIDKVTFEKNIITVTTSVKEKKEVDMSVTYTINDNEFVTDFTLTIVTTSLEYIDEIGAGICDIEGNVYVSIEAWKAAGSPETQGILVSDGTHKFVVAKEYIKPVAADSGMYEYWGGYLIEIDADHYFNDETKLTDFDGQGNTERIITILTEDNHDENFAVAPYSAAGLCAEYEFPNGQNGYLWAAGEENICVEHKKLIENLMSGIKGNTNWLKEYAWSSTLLSSDSAWFYYFSGSYWDGSNKSNDDCVVPVCAFPLSL